jgi:hypothetical protein
MRYYARERGADLVRELCITVDDFPQWVNDVLEARAGLFEIEGFPDIAARLRALKYTGDVVKPIGSFCDLEALRRGQESAKAYRAGLAPALQRENGGQA